MPHGETIVNFPGQESNERIFVYLRRYPLAFVPALLTIFLMVILGVAIIFILGTFSFLNRSEQILLGSAFLMFTLLFAMVEFIDFYFDLDIVTDRRIVDIDQNLLFNRTTAQLLFDDIEDVKAKPSGFWQTIFNYGDVEIQTAGSVPNFVFNDVKNPNEIASIILDLSDQTQRGVAIADRHPEGPVAAVIDDRLIPHTADHSDEV